LILNIIVNDFLYPLCSEVEQEGWMYHWTDKTTLLFANVSHM